MINHDEGAKNFLVSNLMEPDFKNSGYVMTKNISHQSIGIFSVAHVEGQRNVFNHFNIVEK